MTGAARERPAAWKWWVCGLLLCASAINYMDRQTLANASVRITNEFHLKQEQYGDFELAFGWAFAVGSLGFGWLADRVPIRWLYPVVLLLWSLVGFATGLVNSYFGLLVCRAMLGFFEAGHWPCAIKTTQRLLAGKDRTMGNGLLQSGTSIGAVITPLLMNLMMTDAPGSWRLTFQAIGLAGVFWIGAWFWLIRRGELGVVADADVPGGETAESFWRVLISRRFLIILATITLINTSWQLLRAWLPKFMIEGRGYTESAALKFNALFYVATDVGCLGAGFLSLWLFRRAVSVHRARVGVFFACAALTALSSIAAVMPKGGLLLLVLLLVGAGALGLFPTYHALTQEISPVHQGKVTGIAGVVAWAIGPPMQKLFGRWVDQTGSFDLGMVMVGWPPVVAFLGLWLFWNRRAPMAVNSAPPKPV